MNKENENIKGYCVKDKESIEMKDPKAVFTSKGQPATRGICPKCGTNVFRMGRTYLHEGMTAPETTPETPTAKT